MFLSQHIKLPFEDPVIVFSLVLFIIFFAPIALKKLKLPGIIGLIIAGVLIGPDCFNLLARTSSIDLFGKVGLIYIMFLAGIEIDLNDFIKNRNKSIVFGLLTFIIPFTAGCFISYYFLYFSLPSSILIAIIFSTQTLVAFPIISKMGLTKNIAVTATIGGTIITDTLVLLVLAMLTNFSKGQLDTEFVVKQLISLIVFVFIVLWLVPFISKWFFKNIQSEGSTKYIFVLSLVFASAFIAQLAGVEPIIGAFLSGLAFNRMIPRNSALMNRIEFVGNTLFIPIFLISVGMLINLQLLFNGTTALIISGIIISVAFLSKWLAAFVTQKIFKFSSLERGVMYGLSSAHAAAALAVILVGYRIGLANENVLNATILLIFFSCLVSSFITERAGRKLAIDEAGKNPECKEIQENIMIPLLNPSNVYNLIELAILIKKPKSTEPINILSVVGDNEDVTANILNNRKLLDETVKRTAASDNVARLITRVDLNVASGIIRAMKEIMITELIIGWNGKISTLDWIFGTTLETLLYNSTQMVLVTNIVNPLNTTQNIVVIVPPNSEYETGFIRWLSIVSSLSKQVGAKIVFYCNNNTSYKISKVISDDLNQSVQFTFIINNTNNFLDEIEKDFNDDDFLIFINARKGMISYNIHLERIPRHISQNHQKNSFIIIYPEQKIINLFPSSLQTDTSNTFPIQENIERINKLGKNVKKIFKK